MKGKILLFILVLTGCTRSAPKDIVGTRQPDGSVKGELVTQGDDLAVLTLQTSQARMQAAQAMIDYAQSMQEEIDRLRAKGEDSSTLEARRDSLLQSANQAFDERFNAPLNGHLTQQAPRDNA